MKILSTLKKYTAHMLATGFTITLAACYGPMDDDYVYSIRGNVSDSFSGEGIAGIKVCANQEGEQVCGVTNISGDYQMDPDGIIRMDIYQVCAEDVDDATNGIYSTKCISVDSYNDSPIVNFQLDSTNLKNNHEK
jgi:hypothetical protein